jgi:hypothetical protein
LRSQAVYPPAADKYGKCQMNEPQNQPKNALIPGLAILGCFVTGIAAFVGAFFVGAFFVGEGIAVPLCLFVSLLSFGLIVWVSYR